MLSHLSEDLHLPVEDLRPVYKPFITLCVFLTLAADINSCHAAHLTRIMVPWRYLFFSFITQAFNM